MDNENVVNIYTVEFYSPAKKKIMKLVGKLMILEGIIISKVTDSDR